MRISYKALLALVQSTIDAHVRCYEQTLCWWNNQASQLGHIRLEGDTSPTHFWHAQQTVLLIFANTIFWLMARALAPFQIRKEFERSCKLLSQGDF